MPEPVLAIVGRPNVGKSSFFNRLIGEQVAIVEDQPGTTRDRIYGSTEWNGVTFTVIDTGGMVLGQAAEPGSGPQGEVTEEDILQRTREQAEAAIEEADVILLMVDAKTGLTSTDSDIADVLRKSKKPVIVAANKADSEERRLNAVEFYALGLGDPIPISSKHSINTGDLLDQVVAALPAQVEGEEEEDEEVKIAIVGRPNVGKSRLLNAILGQERVIVSDVPGTTRDAVDTQFEYTEGEGEEAVNYNLTLIDTAGIRKRGRIDPGIERYSVIRTLKAIQRADVVLMVIDATEGITAQDTHIAGYVLDEVKGMVLVVNKWDLVEKDSNTIYEYTDHLRQELSFIPYVTFVFISAKFGQRVNKVLPVALSVARERTKRVSTGQLNKLMKEAVDAHPPASKPGKWVKFYYATQADVKPPTFVFFTNDADSVHFSYKRYLENQLRGAFGFEGTPIKLIFRTRQHTD
ncbi:MAG TPA: ribosome biogenesis GTPase Der [Chloroflexia bacterium]|nr:ribosome biogenesis GTPase Der [Chloroflexia bacterium]